MRRKDTEENPTPSRSHLRKLGWHMDCSVDGNLILQLKDTKKKTTLIHKTKPKQTTEKDLGLPIS